MNVKGKRMNELEDDVRKKWADWPILTEGEIKLQTIFVNKKWSDSIEMQYKVKFGKKWIEKSAYIKGAL